MDKDLDLFKDVIPSLMEKKAYALTSSDQEKVYNPFVVNRALSHHVDCVLYANDMNLVPFLDKKLQYDYFYYAIKKYKRGYQTWFKAHKQENELVVMEYYKCNKERAREILEVLTPEQVSSLSERMSKGGKF